MSGNKKLTSKSQSHKKLLVEGSDDWNVCYHLLKSHRIAVKDRYTKKGISPRQKGCSRNQDRRKAPPILFN